jgi:four helix bundle protein
MTDLSQRNTHDEPPFDICERTFRFAVRIVKFCAKLDQKPGVSWGLSKQLLRSGTSVGANIEEGQGAQSKPDFISKYSIARKEARETSYWLRLISATDVSHQDEIQELLNEIGQLIKILTTIIKNTQQS